MYSYTRTYHEDTLYYEEITLASLVNPQGERICLSKDFVFQCMSLNRGQIPVLGHGGFEQTIEILKCLDNHHFESLPHREKRVVENDGF